MIEIETSEKVGTNDASANALNQLIRERKRVLECYTITDRLIHLETLNIVEETQPNKDFKSSPKILKEERFQRSLTTNLFIETSAPSGGDWLKIKLISSLI